MSRETLEWLNTNTLIGYTEKRGNTAWHYRANLQGDENNHYPGPIPVEDVSRRLFNWTAKEGKVTVTVIDEDGVLSIEDPIRKAIVRPDTQQIMGLFTDGYKIHDYNEWLIQNIANILDDYLQVASAGLLANSAVAWVQAEAPDNRVGPGGFEHRPFLTGFTSMNGSLATGFTKGEQAVVCDNTLNANISSSAFKIKYKHTANSLARITDVREALDIIQETGDTFDQQLEALLAEKVSENRFNKFSYEWAGGDKVFTDAKPGRSLTMATNKREGLTRMWTADPRVTPWRGTALGVVQAVNTFVHHEGIVRGATRFERNMGKVLKGEWDSLDQSTVNLLAAV